MRLVFMGTSSFAVPSLEALVREGHDIVLVVTQPNRPSGRGLGVHVSPVKRVAEHLELPVFQPEKIREESAVQRIRALSPLDAIVVAAFGQIVPKTILDIPRLGCINIHASILPKYRGAAPIQHAIASGETSTGVTTMLMDPGLDTGDILLQKETEIAAEETAGEVEERLSRIGAELILRTLEGLEKGDVKPVPQDDSQATLAPSIKREAGLIDWSQPAASIVNKIRAFSPRPGAYTYLEGRMVKIWRAELLEEQAAPAPPGEVVTVRNQGVEVSAGQGTVLLTEVQPEGRKRISAADFARGARLQSGKSRFG